MKLVVFIYGFIFEVLGGSTRDIKEEHGRVFFVFFQLIFLLFFDFAFIFSYLFSIISANIIENRYDVFIVGFFLFSVFPIGFYLNYLTKKEKFILTILSKVKFENLQKKRIIYYCGVFLFLMVSFFIFYYTQKNLNKSLV